MRTAKNKCSLLFSHSFEGDVMNHLLSSFHIDVEELLYDLRSYWEDREDSYRFNSEALTRVKSTTNHFMFCCAHHSETNASCGMMKEYPYGWNCFGCGASGNLGQFIAHVVGLTSEIQGEQFLLKNYLIVSVNERKPIDMEMLLDGNDLDRKRSLFEEEVTRFTRKRHSYISRRGFSERTIQKYEVGFDSEKDAVTFPVRTSKGNVRFIKKRFVSRKGFLNETGIDKKDILYGLFYILDSPNQIREIDLNESETDTMACYEARRPACAILGRILFKEQIRELLKSGIQVVNLFFDNDKSGIECCINAYQLLSKMTAIRVNVVIYPGGHWGIDGKDEMMYKDANDLLKAGKMEHIRVVPYEEFIGLLVDLKELDIKWKI